MRKVKALAGAAIMVAMLGAPVLAGSCPPPSRCEAAGGNEITPSVNALPGHNLPEAPAGYSKVTICHFGQEHTTDFVVAYIV